MKGIDTIRRGMVQWLSLRLTVYEDFCGSWFIHSHGFIFYEVTLILRSH